MFAFLFLAELAQEKILLVMFVTFQWEQVRELGVISLDHSWSHHAWKCSKACGSGN